MRSPSPIPLLILLLVVTAALSAQAQPNERIAALATATVAALQKTDAAPVADILSNQASSLVAAPEGQVIRVTKPLLKNKTTWADQPLLSAEAKLGEVTAEEAVDATHVSATVEDGAAKLNLDGLAVVEGGKARWLMLAVMPEAQADAAADEAAVGEVTAVLNDWRQAAEKGEVAKVLGVFAPDSISFSVSGPDYGFYVFDKPSDLQAFLVGQATAAGPLVLTESTPPEVTARGSVATSNMLWQVGVAGFPAMPLQFRAHLYKEGGAWKAAGICGLRVD